MHTQFAPTTCAGERRCLKANIKKSDLCLVSVRLLFTRVLVSKDEVGKNKDFVGGY